jgi:hypothetical protein
MSRVRFPAPLLGSRHDAIRVLSLRDALRGDEDDGSPRDPMIHMLAIGGIAPRRSDRNA